MRIIHNVSVSPIVNDAWWNKHVEYSSFRRQGIDIVCASFIHKGNNREGVNNEQKLVFLVTGLMESFIKYSEVIESLYRMGYNVFTYDHQSQGLSERWLSETQSLWIHSFEDYVDDFVYFVSMVSKEYPKSPVYLIAHSMGGFIAAIAMSRLPSLIQRAVLIAPMLRNKCGLKMFDFKVIIPQTISYFATQLSCYFGLGTMHAIGYFKEKPSDNLTVGVTTSDIIQLRNWQDLRQKYPQLIARCVTNDWVLHSLRAQEKFSRRYEFVATNTLILSAEHDYFVYNRAITHFLTKAPSAKRMSVDKAYHEILQEKKEIVDAALTMIDNFFKQGTDDASNIDAVAPFYVNGANSVLYTLPELLIRGCGIMTASIGVIAGVLMLVNGIYKKKMIL